MSVLSTWFRTDTTSAGPVEATHHPLGGRPSSMADSRGTQGSVR